MATAPQPIGSRVLRAGGGVGRAAGQWRAALLRGALAAAEGESPWGPSLGRRAWCAPGEDGRRREQHPARHLRGRREWEHHGGEGRAGESGAPPAAGLRFSPVASGTLAAWLTLGCLPPPPPPPPPSVRPSPVSSLVLFFFFFVSPRCWFLSLQLRPLTPGGCSPPFLSPLLAVTSVPSLPPAPLSQEGFVLRCTLVLARSTHRGWEAVLGELCPQAGYHSCGRDV